MIALSKIIASVFMLTLIGLPIWLQTQGHSPLWLIPFAFLYSILWLPLDRRATFHANAEEIHGEKAGYVTHVKPIFMALWVSGAIYAITLVLRRWVL